MPGRRQFSEAKTLGELTKRAWELEVQVMIEDTDTLAENTDYSGLLTVWSSQNNLRTVTMK
jgi:hypothetical protein